MPILEESDTIYLPEGKFEITIDRDSIMSAIQFWLDKKVLKRPCSVVGFDQHKDMGQLVNKFTIELDVHAGEEDQPPPDSLSVERARRG